jgi:porin
LKHQNSFSAALLPGLLPGLALLLMSEAGRTESAASGITFNAAYTGEVASNLSGGIRTGSDYMDNLDLQIAADRGSIFGVPGLSGLLYGLYNSRNDFSEDYVGNAQIVSSIDSGDGLRLYEAWLDWASDPAERFSVRAGLYDINAEFDSMDTGGLFLNSSHGMGIDFGQSGLNGPGTFPVTALALRLKTNFATGAYGQFAVLDGVPGDPDDIKSNEINLSSADGALLAAEGGLSGGAWRKLAIGLWRYTASFDQLTGTTPSGDPERSNGNQGWYAIADRTLWTGDSGVLAGFLRFGQAEDRFNTFDGYIGVGTSLTGFWPARPDDAVGFGIATAFTGDNYEEAQELAGSSTDSRETNLELTYRIPIADWLTLQPDIQYVIDPGVNPELDNALVFLLRFELSFSKQLTGG